MDGVELPSVLSAILKGVGLVKLEGIVLLGKMIHPYHIETSTVVSHGGTPSPAEQIQQFMTHRLPPSPGSTERTMKTASYGCVGANSAGRQDR